MRPILAALFLAAALAVPAVAPATAAAAEPNFPASMSGYHNWPELVAEIMQAQKDHPDIVSIFSIGKSYQGRDIWVAKVSDNVATDEARARGPDRRPPPRPRAPVHGAGAGRPALADRRLRDRTRRSPAS